MLNDMLRTVDAEGLIDVIKIEMVGLEVIESDFQFFIFDLAIQHPEQMGETIDTTHAHRRTSANSGDTADRIRPDGIGESNILDNDFVNPFFPGSIVNILQFPTGTDNEIRQGVFFLRQTTVRDLTGRIESLFLVEENMGSGFVPTHDRLKNVVKAIQLEVGRYDETSPDQFRCLLERDLYQIGGWFHTEPIGKKAGKNSMAKPDADVSGKIRKLRSCTTWLPTLRTRMLRMLINPNTGQSAGMRRERSSTSQA